MEPAACLGCQPKVETVNLVSVIPKDLAVLQTNVDEGGCLSQSYAGEDLQIHGQMSLPPKKVRSLLGLAKALTSSEVADELFLLF